MNIRKSIHTGSLQGGIAGLLLILSGGPIYAADWNEGDVFAGVGAGNYDVYDNNGIYKETINVGSSGFTTGCAFNLDQSSLYTTDFSAGFVVQFDTLHPHTILDNINTTANGGGSPESIVFDGAGNFYVGHAGANFDIQKFDSANAYVQSYDVAVGPRGSDWIDLAGDQQTMYYTSEGTTIRTYDVVGDAQGADFSNVLGGAAYALRILPDGGVLVADSADIKRLDAAGAVAQTYDAGGENSWFALNLDPNGTSFWSGDFGTGNFYRFNIDTGVVEVGPINAAGSGLLFGLCVKGEPTAAGGIVADIDIKFCSNPNGFNCRKKGVLPVTIFGSGMLDVSEIDLSTVELCLASDTDVCTGPVVNSTIEDRGDPETDLGASQCAIDPGTGEELNTLNPDGNDDIDVRFDSQDAVSDLGLCDGLEKGDETATLVIKGQTNDGTEFISEPLDDVGIDRLLKQNNN